MDLEESSALALRLMEQHGLLQSGWDFEYDRAKTRFGRCSYRRRVISLSRYLTPLRDEMDVRDTILHEIAHALTPGAHHGPRWRSKAREIGCNGERCGEGPVLPGRYTYTCAGCNGRWNRHRRFKRPMLCRRCHLHIREEVRE